MLHLYVLPPDGTATGIDVPVGEYHPTKTAAPIASKVLIAADRQVGGGWQNLGDVATTVLIARLGSCS